MSISTGPDPILHGARTGTGAGFFVGAGLAVVFAAGFGAGFSVGFVTAGFFVAGSGF